MLLGEVPAQSGDGVVTQPGLGQLVPVRRSLGFDGGRRDVAKDHVGGELTQAIAVASHERGDEMVAAPSKPSGERTAARHAPQERHDTVGSGQRPVEVEGDDGGRHAASPSSMFQYAGQLFETTCGSATTMPGTTVPITPNAIASLWSWWVATCTAAQSRRRGLDDEPVSGLVDRGAERPQLAGEVAETIALLAADEPHAGDACGRLGEQRHRRQRRHQIGDVGHVDVDTT